VAVDWAKRGEAKISVSRKPATGRMGQPFWIGRAILPSRVLWEEARRAHER
jgi:hypothetical protein